jgi:hypothetical protein
MLSVIYAECHICAECFLCSVIMLRVIMVSVVYAEYSIFNGMLRIVIRLIHLLTVNLLILVLEIMKEGQHRLSSESVHL